MQVMATMMTCNVQSVEIIFIFSSVLSDFQGMSKLACSTDEFTEELLSSETPESSIDSQFGDVDVTLDRPPFL